jgi:hypothetical protein
VRRIRAIPVTLFLRHGLILHDNPTW